MLLFSMVENEKDLSKFQQIYDQYKNMMYWVAYDITKNTHDAEDVVPLSLIKLIDILYRIEEEEIGRSRCKNLLITITKNTAIDHLRKASHAPIPFETVEKPDTSRSAEDLYIETEDYKKLIQCIDKLDEKYTEVLRLRLLHHLSARETAKILNISEFNVNTRLLRAKRLLAELLREVLK